MTYHISTKSGLGFEEAAEKVRQELMAQGFGVLTEIDVKATLKKKLNKDFRRYLILGACNPELAFRALSLEDKLGVLLPCNVVVQELADGEVEVSAMDPGIMQQLVDNPELREVALEVQRKLRAVIGKF